MVLARGGPSELGTDLPKHSKFHYDAGMKRLLIVAFAMLLTLSASLRAVGPDDLYIEIYKLIQEGDQLATTGQSETARQRYAEAHAELKQLQASYPNWNMQLVAFRLRMLGGKIAPPPRALPLEAEAQTDAPESTQPPGQPQGQPPQTIQPLPEPVQPARQPAPAPTPAPLPEFDDRDNQIQALRQQVSRLQNDRAILDAKLREALAIQPAAVDPRELARAEERILALEKDKEILRVSLSAAESKAAERNEEGAAELKAELADARRKLNEQSETILALRQEKTLLQQHLEAATRSDQSASLRAENEALKKQLAEKPAASAAQAGNPQLEKELASTKAALQSSRDTMNSLQVRLRTLQEERDRLETARRDLEAKLAAAPTAASPGESVKLVELQKERDELQAKLAETTRQLADNRARAAQAEIQPAALRSLDEAAGMRARLEVLEARKVPYTIEELALFKKPQAPAVVASAPPQPAAAKELSASTATLLAEAQSAFGARRFEEAEKKYQEVLEFDDKNTATLQRLSAVQLEQNRPKDAEANLKRALEVNPRDARTLLLLGIAQFDQDKFDEAFDSLSRSAQADPQNPETQNYLGITLSQKGQRGAAETALRKAIQLSPSYSSAHYNLAVIYATQQPPFTELARWHYQKALAFGHPQNADVEKLIERKQATPQE